MKVATLPDRVSRQKSASPVGRIMRRSPVGVVDWERVPLLGGSSKKRRRAPIVAAEHWRELPEWILLHAERGTMRKCWSGHRLFWTAQDGRVYGDCEVRGCGRRPKAGEPILACPECRWSICSNCAPRPRMPPLAHDELFHGPNCPCVLVPPVLQGAWGGVPAAPSDPAFGFGTVIICPGGNYEFLSPLEALPVVEWLSERNIGSVVLKYRLLPRFALDDALDDLEAAAAAARSARPGPVCAIGFSAGGHLIASLGARATERGQPQPLDAQARDLPCACLGGRSRTQNPRCAPACRRVSLSAHASRLHLADPRVSKHRSLRLARRRVGRILLEWHVETPTKGTPPLPPHPR